MATVVSTPVLAWAATILTSTGVQQSSSTTITVNNTGGWEILIPVKVTYSNISNDPVVNVYSSNDGGTSYDTSAMTSFALPRVSGGGTTQGSIRIPTGQYVIQLLSSGPSSGSVTNNQTWSVLTQQIVTAVQNV